MNSVSNVPGKITQAEAEACIRKLLHYIGEDPDRNGLSKTPARVIKAYSEFFSGYDQSVTNLFETSIPADHNEVVVLAGIRFFSFCEHHMLPFHGVCHVGYIPNKRLAGIGSLTHLVEIYAKRLQIQERMTDQIAEGLLEGLNPFGAAVIIQAEHMCLSCRGAKKKGAILSTSAMLGRFQHDQYRQEFYRLCDMSFQTGVSKALTECP